MIVVLASGLMTLPAAAKGGFKLISAVPDDVFILTAMKHNPEREFIEDYWGEVISALKATGIGSDTMELIGSLLGDAQRMEVERLKEKASQLLDGVDWKQLKGGEFVFAERLNVPSPSGSTLSMGPPDIVWLVRGVEGSASKNYDGLVAIMREIAVEVNKAAEKEVLAVDTTPRMGAKVATLMSPALGPALSIAVASHGETIIISIGERMLEDVLDLMNGKGTKKSLSASPRFKQAFKKLPQAEDMMSFLDMQALLGSIRAMVDLGLAAASAQVEDVTQRQPLGEEARQFVDKAVEVYRAKDYKQALQYTQKAYEIAPDNTLVLYNLACFSALVGDKDKALTWLEKAVDAGYYAPNMISRDSDLDSLRDDARYRAAVAKATDKARAENPEKDRWIATVQHLVKQIMEVPGIIDYIASVEHTDGYSTRSNCHTVLVPGAADISFYPVFGTRNPLTDFERYLPKETISFSVNAGIDLKALYKFIEDTIRQAGPKGQEIMAQWEAVQQEVGLDVRKDLLGWIDSELIHVTLKQPMGDATVLMLKVIDETTAREKLATGLSAVSSGLQQAAQTNPMLAMMAIQATPATHEKLTGFHNVTIGMQPQPSVLGVANGYAIFGTSADAVALGLATAAGEHPSIKKNAQVMGEALVPDGKFRSMSFTDKRKLGQEIADVLGVVGMFGGMAAMAIPDPQAQQALNKGLQMVLKLGPVAKKIDFYKSSASYASFDGRVWHTRGATNYKSPAERVDSTGDSLAPASTPQ
jgi:hypothetical protein